MRHAWLLALSIGCGCSDWINLVTEPGPDAAPGPSADAAAQDAAAQDAAAQDAAAQDAATPVNDGGARSPAMCGGQPCACDNGLDDDDDGLIDGFDPECTGAFDRDESSFATGQPGESGGSCRDCFFDGNSGPGDDGCRYPESCLMGMPPLAPAGGCGNSCDLQAQCGDSCLAVTPNGCDCFGCCEVTRDDDSRVTVFLADSCSLDAVDDPLACPQCVQSEQCRNPCGMCELCPGKTEDELPELCGDSGGDERPYRCDEGQAQCSFEQPCAADFFCQLGCCLLIPQ